LPKKVDRDRRRQQILSRAADLFARRGFGGVTMRQVARALGCSTGAVYHFFPSKEALLRDCVRQAAEEQMSQARAVVAEHQNGPQQLAALTRHLLGHSAGYQRLLLLMLAVMQSRSSTLRTQTVSKVRDEQVDWLSEVFRHVPREGEPPADDPRAAARLFLAMIDGLLMQSQVTSRGRDAKAIDQAVSFLLGALDRDTE
jgi:AcrR family transcriptional regulator